MKDRYGYSVQAMEESRQGVVFQLLRRVGGQILSDRQGPRKLYCGILRRDLEAITEIVLKNTMLRKVSKLEPKEAGENVIIRCFTVCILY